MYFVRRSLIPVFTEPGSTVVSQTPWGDISKRAAVAKPFRAALLATYDDR